MIWLGLHKHKKDYLKDAPKGYDMVGQLFPLILLCGRHEGWVLVAKYSYCILFAPNFINNDIREYYFFIICSHETHISSWLLLQMTWFIKVCSIFILLHSHRDVINIFFWGGGGPDILTRFWQTFWPTFQGSDSIKFVVWKTECLRGAFLQGEKFARVPIVSCQCKPIWKTNKWPTILTKYFPFWPTFWT